MKKAFSILLAFPLTLHALAGQRPVPEVVQQARLIRFKPAVTKTLNPDLLDTEFLTTIARDTWGYFRDVVDRENGIPLDNVLVTATHTKVMSYTSTTNIGLYLMGLAAAQDLGFISPGHAEVRARKALETLKQLPRWEGQFFNYYETITLKPSSPFVSSVDNGWLAAGLVVVAQAYPSLREEAEAFLDEMDFSKLYDADAGQLHVGYESDKGTLTKNHYGLLCTEPRVSSYIGIAKGDLPEAHWYRVSRTLPADWTWQNQIPRGVNRTVKGVDVFYGFYSRDNFRFVPSWGGSLFEFLMPTLVLNEREFSPDGLGANNRTAVEAQIHYALQIKRYPLWGISPCATPDSPQGYKEYGVPFLGVKGYPDDGVVTPHVSFLALGVAPEAAIENLRRFARIKGFYGEYGFYDSLNVRTGKMSPRFLALDQGMTLVALANYLKNGSVRNRFMAHRWMKEKVGLLSNEVYFEF